MPLDLVDRQQQEIAFLRERIRQLEDALVPQEVLFPIEWALTGSEARLLAYLTTRDLATKPQIHAALYSLRPDGDDPELKIVDVFVCKLRRKLKPFGVVIETRWGYGYALRDRLRYAAVKRQNEPAEAAA
jgi:two-component system, cell cycle response regulator CtrA